MANILQASVEKIAVMACALLFALSIGNTEALGQQTNYIGDLSGLERMEGAASEVYIRPGVNFGKYKRVMANPVIFDFINNPDMGGLSDEDLTVIQEAYRAAGRKHIISKYPASATAGADVLRISAVIRDLELIRLDPSMNEVNLLTFSIEPGSAMIQLTFRDSLSGQIIAAAVDRYQGEVGARDMTRKISTRLDAEEAADYWAQLIRQRWDSASSSK